MRASPDRPPEASELEPLIVSAASEAGLALPPSTPQRLAIHLAMTLKWSRAMSLTAITDPAAAVRLHVVESLLAARHVVPAGGGLLDIGSGNGYPALPIKTLHPGMQATLLEPALRRGVFLESVARAAGLEDVRVRRERVERGGDLARYPGLGTITLRAVKVVDQVLEGAPEVLPSGGRIVLLLGAALGRALSQSPPPGLALVLFQELPHRKHACLVVLERR